MREIVQSCWVSPRVQRAHPFDHPYFLFHHQFFFQHLAKATRIARIANHLYPPFVDRQNFNPRTIILTQEQTHDLPSPLYSFFLSQIKTLVSFSFLREKQGSFPGGEKISQGEGNWRRFHARYKSSGVAGWSFSPYGGCLRSAMFPRNSLTPLAREQTILSSPPSPGFSCACVRARGRCCSAEAAEITGSLLRPPAANPKQANATSGEQRVNTGGGRNRERRNIRAGGICREGI